MPVDTTPTLYIRHGRMNIVVSKGIDIDGVTFTFNRYDADGKFLGVKDLTGFTARLKITSLDKATEYASYTPGSGLTMGGSAGTIQWDETAANIAGFATAEARYTLELEDAEGNPGPGFAGLFTRDDEQVDP